MDGRQRAKYSHILTTVSRTFSFQSPRLATGASRGAPTRSSTLTVRRKRWRLFRFACRLRLASKLRLLDASVGLIPSTITHQNITHQNKIAAQILLVHVRSISTLSRAPHFRNTDPNSKIKFKKTFYLVSLSITCCAPYELISQYLWVFCNTNLFNLINPYCQSNFVHIIYQFKFKGRI